MELVTGKQFKLDVWEECLKTMRQQEVSDFFVDKSVSCVASIQILQTCQLLQFHCEFQAHSFKHLLEVKMPMKMTCVVFAYLQT